MKENVRKFVTRSHESWSKDEIKQAVDNFKKQIEGNSYGIKYKRYTVSKDDTMSTLCIDFKMPHYIGRDERGARFEMMGMYFICFKSKGEIEVDWKNNIYTPFDGVCYSSNIRFDARWCRYHGKTWENYQKKCPYQYGDEISDLNYDEVLTQLYKDLRLCSVIK